MNEIKKAIIQEDWKHLVKNFLPVNFADTLSFPDSMKLAGQLIKASVDEMTTDGFTADLYKDFSVNLMTIVRAKYPEEWKSDWKNEAFLGIACALVYREEEAFVYIKNAYDHIEDPPQSLIFLLINAGTGPDRQLGDEEIIKLTEKALEKGITFESAQRMASLKRKHGEEEQYQFWKQKAVEAKEKMCHTPIITPNCIKKFFKLEKGYQYEK